VDGLLVRLVVAVLPLITLILELGDGDLVLDLDVLVLETMGDVTTVSLLKSGAVQMRLLNGFIALLETTLETGGGNPNGRWLGPDELEDQE